MVQSPADLFIGVASGVSPAMCVEVVSLTPKVRERNKSDEKHLILSKCVGFSICKNKGSEWEANPPHLSLIVQSVSAQRCSAFKLVTYRLSATRPPFCQTYDGRIG